MSRSNELDLPPLPLNRRWVLEKDEDMYMRLTLEESSAVRSVTGFFRKSAEEKKIWKSIKSVYVYNSKGKDDLAAWPSLINRQAALITTDLQNEDRQSKVLDDLAGVYEPRKIETLP